MLAIDIAVFVWYILYYPKLFQDYPRYISTHSEVIKKVNINAALSIKVVPIEVKYPRRERKSSSDIINPL